MKNSDRRHFDTLAVHAGRRIDPTTGGVATPIYVSCTFERDPDGTYSRGFSYSREENPNRRMLEECLAALEGGKEALAFSSGLAVATAALQGLEPGDHVLIADDVYYALRRVVKEVFGKWPIEVQHADMTNIDTFRAAVRPNTRLVWAETPSNPLLKIVDLAAIAEIARQTKAITICDGTFTTPVLQRPLDLGIDMVMHSTTKYLSGHSDAVGGAIITRYDNYLFERMRKSQQLGGAVPSPFDSWLTLRSIETLPVRVRAQCASAMQIAEWLAAHPRIEAVHYPGLATHPGHDIACRQMAGFGGMLSFQVRGNREQAKEVTRRVKLIIRATSLGATHSLIEHRASIEGPASKTPGNLLRLSTGLEHVGDLIADLDQAIDAALGHACS
ncbi:MAG: aminotransferase class I/II-fold pyridoxal phosphate-dependent enzyme [Bryobacteraceae bacterium]